ncbi:MAG: hypothetical protein EPN34_13955 [Burkholderiaceae bacterium]|nr:MAG: hypothetical protein EPN34_13955 [Burkholderiaceae bacterium]
MPITNTQAVGIAAPKNAITITGTTEPRVDSRLLAKQLDNHHKNTWELIQRHKAKLEGFGHLPFQTEVGKRAQGGGNPQRYALLNENQCHFLLTLSKNTPRVVELKANLITAFSEARRAAELNQEYLPTYHALHDQIRALPGDPEHERYAHMNVNKLLNKVTGIETGGRSRADVPSKALLIVAQHMAVQAMQGAMDRSDGYARVKVALVPLAMLIGQKKSAVLGSEGANQIAINESDCTNEA